MEEKLEEMLEEYYSYCDDKGDRIFNEYCVRELLKSISEQDNWISVEERLPDTEEEYGESDDVLGFEHSISKKPVVVWYNSKLKNWYVSHYKADFVPIQISHWKPLPHPPKVKETEK